MKLQFVFYIVIYFHATQEATINIRAQGLVSFLLYCSLRYKNILESRKEYSTRDCIKVFLKSYEIMPLSVCETRQYNLFLIS